jgi:PilZ domain
MFIKYKRGTMVSMSTSTRSANRRRAERRESYKSLALVVDSGQSEIANQSFAVDLSELGIRVRTGLRLEPGQTVTVIPCEGEAYAVPSRVVWVHGEPYSDHQEAGLAFMEPQSVSSGLVKNLW